MFFLFVWPRWSSIGFVSPFWAKVVYLEVGNSDVEQVELKNNVVRKFSIKFFDCIMSVCLIGSLSPRDGTNPE